MKNLDLNAYGVREMARNEMLNVNGGWIEGALCALGDVFIVIGEFLRKVFCRSC
jgi:hypothetical protein